MKYINAIIDGINVSVPDGLTIMEAADRINAHVPRLCYHPFLSTEGSCRVCSVKVEGYGNLLPACATKLQEGMKITTNSPELRETRRDLVELLLDNHPRACLTCERDGNCELQNLSYKLGVRHRVFDGARKRFPIDKSNVSVVRDAEKCILCRRCVRVCSEIQGVHNLSQMFRGVNTVVTPAFQAPMDDSVCIKCGQCINVCPTAAFIEKNDTEDVWEILKDPNKFVVAQTAPAIRAAINEGWDLPHGRSATGKTVAALRRLGFDAVFDTDFTADLTIMEESHELIERLNNGGTLPLITSCSPGWINFVEHFYPELLPNVSSCKSPMQMLSTLIKTYYAEKTGRDPKDIYVVAVMPCVAKKFEAKRPDHYSPEGIPYTDTVVTTRELIWMIKAYGIDFPNLPEEDFDTPMGISSGAGDIFGSTGGVMEAALRTAYEKITGESITNLNFTEVRAIEGLREATIDIKGTLINVAVANGLNNAKTILEKVKKGEKQYHLIEIMACPGGCVAGGGQPLSHVEKYVYPLDKDMIKLRQNALYDIDSGKTLRKSHENPAIIQIYKEFLGEPGSHTAHELLHTNYSAKLPRGIK
ncbi:MAG: [FeFe] hydrogenase, group A [Candidatus Kapabacteria bacterium]|nr:[FeFe] hydrogenase, group A [Ignavibacteriota bacterium]MCW5885066.1 [FeFe] hydrogenase, group A [Candidatus Kapabacteria bacterium]